MSTRALPWFRMYTDFLNDPKMISIAFEDQRHFIGVLALKSAGILDQECDEKTLNRIVAQRLWIDYAVIEDVKKRLVAASLIDDSWQPVSWDKRQFTSDADVENAVRQKNWRERQKTGIAQLIKAQKGRCDCCDEPFQMPYAKFLVQDHHHDSGANRGLLCQSCNSVVGRIENGLDVHSGKRAMAEAYIARHKVRMERNAVTGVDTDTQADGEEKGAKAPSSTKHAYTEEFEQAWGLYPKRPGANKLETFKAWNARLKQGSTAIEMTDGTRRYAAYCQAMKTEPRFIKQPATFFGPDNHFSADWSVPLTVVQGGGSRSDRNAAWMAGMTGNHGGQQHDRPGDVIDVTARRV